MMEKKLLPKRDKRCLIFVGAFLFSLAPRLAKLMIDPLLMRDAASYLNMVERWFDCNSYQEVFALEQNVVPPFALWTVKAFMRFGFGSEVTGRALNLFVGSLIPVVCMVLTYMIFKKIPVSVIAFLLCACHPKLVNYSIQPLRDNFNLLFVGLFFVFITVAVRTGKLRNWCGAGIASAFAVFTRYESMELLLVAAALAVALCIKERNIIRGCFRRFALFLASFSISFYLIKLMVGCDLSFVFKINHYLE